MPGFSGALVFDDRLYWRWICMFYPKVVFVRVSTYLWSCCILISPITPNQLILTQRVETKNLQSTFTHVAIWYLYCRLQVRYGDHWGPIHPSGMPSGTLTEICLEDGESFTHVDVMDGWVIDILHFHSNLRAHDAVGYNPSQSTTRTVPLKDVIYFSGAAYLHDELRVTKFLPHREDCDSWAIHSIITMRHADIIKWKYFPCYWPFVRGIHMSPVNSPHKC